MLKFFKSPFNYIGNKYRIMGKIHPYFPNQINTFVDLFCGGCDVTINTKAKIYYANDINNFVIDIYKAFQNNPKEVIPYIENTIEKYQLSKTNEESYKLFRDYYNKTRNPLDLYVLMCYSFNYQFRFNSSHEYNNPFGRNRSSFNSSMKKNLEIFLEKIKGVRFSSTEFGMYDLGCMTEEDFIYCDPPYSLTCGSYNDGKRGFNGWGLHDDSRLFLLLDGLSHRNVKFALSNVIEHKGVIHESMMAWVNRNNYKINYIDFDYNNCNYHTKNRDNITKEVLITNY